MSSHVVVLDSTARRATVKTAPSKPLIDILQEACSKFGLDPSQHGLKHKSKELDLSLVFRLSALSSGAKLELVQLSRSPSVVTVALQLPESEAGSAPNARLVDKFPSTTTLWLVLRKFESGVAGNGSTRNLTARSVPIADNGAPGSGRLFYEIPVVRVMERELSTFADLQKSLAQLGFNSGNILLRLGFRTTEEPLEEAMVRIVDYFKSVGEEFPKTTQESSFNPATTTATVDAQNGPKPTQQPKKPLPTDSPQQPFADEATQQIQTSLSSSAPPVSEEAQASSVSPRPVTVFSPPTNSTPLSAQATYNENDYVPSIEQAQAHQRRLNTISRPTRLPADAEIAAKSAAEQEKLASIKSVDIKIRFPDQSQVVSKFGNQDTGKTLYDFIRTCLVEPLAATEKFTVTFTPSVAGPGIAGRKIQSVVPESESSLLIRDLGMTGRILVNFSWDTNNASEAVPGRRENILKPELRSQAQEHKVEQPPDVPDESESIVGGSGAAGGRGEGRPSNLRKGGIPKWLKLPGKK